MIKCGIKILRPIMPGILKNSRLYANVKLLQTSHTFYITNTSSFLVAHKEAIVRGYKISYCLHRIFLMYQSEQVFRRRE